MKVIVTDVRNGVKQKLEDVHVFEDVILGIDASTNTTGVSILSVNTGKPLYAISMHKDTGVSAIEYKVEFKLIMQGLLVNNESVRAHCKYIEYEQPFISGMKTTTSVLIMLSTTIQEIMIEYKDKTNDIKFEYINNKTWKNKFFKPDKCPSNTELEKKMAHDKLVALYPIYDSLTQDEIDATCISIVKYRSLEIGTEVGVKKAVHRFSYEIEFISGTSIDDAVKDAVSCELLSADILELPMRSCDIPRNGNLEKRIYEDMLESDDLLIYKFTGKSLGNIVLKYRLSAMNTGNSDIYAFVYRKNRKKIK